jgi:hypothetical protein
VLVGVKLGERGVYVDEMFEDGLEIFEFAVVEGVDAFAALVGLSNLRLWV